MSNTTNLVVRMCVNDSKPRLGFGMLRWRSQCGQSEKTISSTARTPA
jgi:hypothetical protein